MKLAWKRIAPLLLAAGASGAAGALPGLSTPDQVIREVRLDQRLDGQVPLDIPFRDETGKRVTLGQYCGSKPVMLNLIQYRCRMLCSQEMNVLLSSLRQMKFQPGREFQLVTVSIDSRETPQLAAEKKASYLRAYGRPGAAAGWHFLTGDDAAIHRLADAIGYHFTYDAATDQFAHPDGVEILTPAGKVAQYYFRLEYAPRDLRLGLIQATANRIGTPLDALALLCYHYDPLTGKYDLGILQLVRLAGLATVLLVGGGVFAMRRVERARSPAADRMGGDA